MLSLICLHPPLGVLHQPRSPLRLCGAEYLSGPADWHFLLRGDQAGAPRRTQRRRGRESGPRQAWRTLQGGGSTRLLIGLPLTLAAGRDPAPAGHEPTPGPGPSP